MSNIELPALLALGIKGMTRARAQRMLASGEVSVNNTVVGLCDEWDRPKLAGARITCGRHTIFISSDARRIVRRQNGLGGANDRTARPTPEREAGSAGAEGERPDRAARARL